MWRDNAQLEYDGILEADFIQKYVDACDFRSKQIKIENNYFNPFFRAPHVFVPPPTSNFGIFFPSGASKKNYTYLWMFLILFILYIYTFFL